MDEKQLRHNFIQYLKTHYRYARPEIMASNVFYAWNHDIGMDFWDIFASEESMLSARQLLIRHFEQIDRKDPAGHASVHHGCWKKFKEFCDSQEILK